MADNDQNIENENDEIYEDIAQVADFVHDRLNNFVEPTALNNTVEEYTKDDEGKNPNEQ